MTDPDAPGSATASVDVVDEASAAAAGTRSAARWIASALGSVPSLAVLASVIRAPGNAGFDATQLALGVGLASAGAILAVLAFARVIAPVPLEDADLRDLDLRRIPGQPYATFVELDRDLTDLRAAAVDAEYAAERSRRLSRHDAREARRPVDDVDARESPEQPPDAVGVSVWEQQLARRDAIRTKAYRLKAADEVGRRYRHAQVAAVVAVTLIAAGIVLLGLAPDQDPLKARGAPTATPTRAGG